MADSYEAGYRRTVNAYDEARRSLLDLAAHAIREAFIAAPVGRQLALSLTRVGERQRLYDALPLIAADERLPWLVGAITGIHGALTTFEKRQYDADDKVAALATALNKAHANVAATILRCPRDEGVVILRNINTGLCVCGVQKRSGKTFVEYETVGATAQGKVRVVTRGETEWAVMP